MSSLGLMGHKSHWPEWERRALWLTLADECPPIGARVDDAVLVYLDGTVLLRRELGGDDLLEVFDRNSAYAATQLSVHGCSRVMEPVESPDLRPGDQLWLGAERQPVAIRRLDLSASAIHILRIIASGTAERTRTNVRGKLSQSETEARVEARLREALPVAVVHDGEAGRRRGSQRGAAWYAARGKAVPSLRAVAGGAQ